MTFDGYFKTENTGGKIEGWSSLKENSINQPLQRNVIKQLILGELTATFAELNGDQLYMQDESDPDTSFKVLNTTSWSGAEQEYSSTSTSTPIYQCITELSGGEGTIFTSDQDLGEHNCKWKVRYNAKVANTPDGYSAYMRFVFKKVDTDDTETELFEIEGEVADLYELGGREASGYPSGEVETTDRLKIEVYHASRPIS